jgi:UDP-N-acetylmuramoyl-tripeptide--D-alanyl-D-alanine ligase
MGMNHAGEMSRLSSIARPNIAVITNIGTAHIGNLGSREGILKAKMEILDFIQPGGLVVLNADDDLLFPEFGKLPYRTVIYGIQNEAAHVKARHLRLGSESSEFEIEVDGEAPISAVVNMAGEHVVYNALASVAVGRELGMPMKEILRGIASVTAEQSGRQNVRKVENFTIIDDCYNACFDSMQASLKALNTMAKGRKVAVLGDMFELGDFAEEFHRKVGEVARKVGVELLITIGKDSNLYMGGDIKTENIEEAYNAVKENVKAGDTVLIKASNGMGLNKLVQKLEGV